MASYSNVCMYYNMYVYWGMQWSKMGDAMLLRREQTWRSWWWRADEKWIMKVFVPFLLRCQCTTTTTLYCQYNSDLLDYCTPAGSCTLLYGWCRTRCSFIYRQFSFNFQPSAARSRACTFDKYLWEMNYCFSQVEQLQALIVAVSSSNLWRCSTLSRTKLFFI